MKEVLVLGNGISRLLHEAFIRKWAGELWACNRAYLEDGVAAKITLLTGHKDVLTEARDYRDEHGLTFVILGAFFGKEQAERPTTCPGEFRKDSGTTLIAQAHEDGYERIHVCGYDLGGPDIWSPRLEQQHKHVWVRRWREIIGHYGSERIHFIGFDHLPYLQSKAREDTYMKRYVRGVPHIPDPSYIALHHMIYGGPDRLTGEKIMKVEFLNGPKKGFVTNMNEAVAMIHVGRGTVKVVEVVSAAPIDETGEEEITADMKITDRMNKDTLLKIAGLKGIDPAVTDGLSNREIRELLAE